MRQYLSSMKRNELVEFPRVARVSYTLVKALCPYGEPSLDASTLRRATKSHRRAGLNLIIELRMLGRVALEIVLLSIGTGFRA